MMPPVVGVVGNSNSGKTTLAAALIEALTGRGYRVAAIKDCPHGHDVDRSGSDSHRLYTAGAATVVATSPDKRTRVDRVDGDCSLESIISSLGLVADLVVAEGFKTSKVPKILVIDDGDPPPSVENVIATVGNGQRELDTGGVPAYRLENIDGLASQLCAQILAAPRPMPSISIVIDGTSLPLAPFPGQLLSSILRGFLSNLKGVPQDPEQIQITIRKDSDEPRPS